MKQEKLNVKDLITIGIMTVLYLVAAFASGMSGMILPVFTVFLPAVSGVLGALAFMLLVTKVGKFGAVTLMGTSMGILFTLMGQHWICIPFGLVFGFLADVIIKSGEYKQFKKVLTGYCIFNNWIVGSMLPMWFMREEYFAKFEKAMPEYIDIIRSLTANYMLPVIVVLGIAGALVGGFFAKKLLNKHFKRAGII
ncbi:MAG: MptD family putative ECF transporter S component [Epulopiscium sp.]|nr:MptD family putative ECF transporter S component [Candidatus Epulonipiscium sp.]